MKKMKTFYKTETLKQNLVNHLKGNGITSTPELWAYTKDWAKENGFLMGGSYGSATAYISVHLRIDDQHYHFDISIEEVN